MFHNVKDANSMPMISKKFVVVGMKFQNVSVDDLLNLESEKLKLIPEPDNKHDSNAVCLFENDRRIGYVRKEDNQKISQIISKGNYEISIKECKETYLSLIIKCTSDLTVDLGNIAKGTSGIYELQIKCPDGTYFYVGQSSDIPSRLKRHIDQLLANSHHNYRLTDAFERANSVEGKILEELNREDSYELSNHLYHSEFSYITDYKKKYDDFCLNISNGEFIYREDVKASIQLPFRECLKIINQKINENNILRREAKKELANYSGTLSKFIAYYLDKGRTPEMVKNTLLKSPETGKYIEIVDQVALANKPLRNYKEKLEAALYVVSNARISLYSSGFYLKESKSWRQDSVIATLKKDHIIEIFKKYKIQYEYLEERSILVVIDECNFHGRTKHKFAR